MSELENLTGIPAIPLPFISLTVAIRRAFSLLEFVEELSSVSESDSSPKFSLLLPPLLIAVGVSSIIN